MSFRLVVYTLKDRLRPHATVGHAEYEGARDDDGDGIREVQVNTIDGLWTDGRIFLRPFNGVHQRLLRDYVAMAEFRRRQPPRRPL